MFSRVCSVFGAITLLLVSISAPGRAVTATGPPVVSAAADSLPLLQEDTVPVPRVTLREVRVETRRVSLEEVLDRIAAGEAHRDSLMHDQVFDLYARVLARNRDGGLRQVVLDQVSRVYKEVPNLVHEVVVRRSGDPGVQIRADQTVREEIVGFAFQPRLRKLYRFEIQGRDFVDQNVLYRIGFEPRSDLYPLPSGRIWVSMAEPVIVREEFWFRGASPSPLIFKSLDHCVVERQRVDEKFWVVSRMMARVQFTLPILGVPPVADVVMESRNFEINRGIDPAVFHGKEEGKP